LVAFEQLLVLFADELLQRRLQAIHQPLAPAHLDHGSGLGGAALFNKLDGLCHLVDLGDDLPGNAADACCLRRVVIGDGGHRQNMRAHRRGRAAI
jgi:hypothetical protein